MSDLLNELRTRLGQLQHEVERESRRLQELTLAIGTKKRAIQAIEELIQLEGGELPEGGKVTQFPVAPGSASSPIADAAYAYLQNVRQQTHYSELTSEVQRLGIPISGRNPGNTLLAHLSRDERFYRPARGTYALREWNPSARSVGVRRKKGA